MEIIATRIYGADNIELSEEARKKVELYTRQVTVFSGDVCRGCSEKLHALNLRVLHKPGSDSPTVFSLARR